ncbi:MAG: WD40/YVTN/BNR-like repeat-containing protein, partial [Acidimicrobiales bacterium]
PLARQGGGGGWAPDGPQTFVERLALSPPAPSSSGGPGAPADRTLVAGGAGLFLAPVTGAGPGRAGHLHWTRVGPFDDHNLVLGMDLPRRGPVAAWVGTVNGLWLAARLGGPYRRVASFPSRTVHAIAVGPTDPAVVWASSAAGFLRSTDGGRHWRAENAGVASPATAWALAFLDGRLYGSAGNAVYRWSGSGWAPTSPQYGVVMLDPTPGGRLFASSMGDGIRMLAGGRWQPADGGLLVHDQGAINGIHVVSVTARPGQPAYAGTMADGVAVSLDGGRSWSRTWSGLAGRGVVWRVVPVGRTLVAATDSGVLAYTLPARPAPSALWWLAVAGSALLAAGTAALVLTGSTRPAGPSPSPGGRAGPGADSTAGA